MKKVLDGHHFASDDDVLNAIDHFLRYTKGIRLLHDRWTKRVTVGGDYIEKLSAFDFLKLIPSILSHGFINHPSYKNQQQYPVKQRTWGVL